MISFFLDIFWGRSIAMRLLWIAGSFLIPIGVLFSIYLNAAEKDIVFAEKEIVGNNYQNRIMEVLRPLLAHRALVNKGAINEDQARRLRSDIEKALDNLEREDARSGKALEFTPEGLRLRKRDGSNFPNLRREWDIIKGEISQTNAKESELKHVKMIETIQSMIVHLGDTSNLILDPDLDSYYLMDASLSALPTLAKRLSDLQARVLMKEKSESNELEMNLLARRASEDDMSRAEKDIETTIAEDERFHGLLEGLSDLKNSTGALKTVVEEALAASLLPEAPTAGSQLSEAIDRTCTCQQAVSTQLEKLLQRRISTFRSQKHMGILLMSASLLLAIALVIWIGFSIVNPMSAGAKSLTSAAENQRMTSLELTNNAEETSTQAQVVSAAAEQVSANVRSVAAAAEEMDATIREVASKAHQAARVAADAVTLAQSTSGLVSSLGESGSRIGGVVKLITSIAEQTNLLALNATIEAARAGEVGKGFAVVANEVKELAKETARATEDISGKINAIQQDTANAVRAISEVQATIKHINDIQSAIASAVEEQSATTREIGRNVTEAARGTADIASNIAGVAQAARGTSAGAHQVSASSGALLMLAGKLRALIGGKTNSKES